MTVTGVDPVTPFRLSDTPGIVWVAPWPWVGGVVPPSEAPLIVFEDEYCVAPPLIVYWASVPGTSLPVSVSAPAVSETWM